MNILPLSRIWLLPLMMAGSIQLAVSSQQRLWETLPETPGAPVWLMLDEEEDDDEEDKELGSPPKLMLMLGNSALRPSCHSFTLILSTQLLFSAWKQGERKLYHQQHMDNSISLKKTNKRKKFCKALLSTAVKFSFWLLNQGSVNNQGLIMNYVLKYCNLIYGLRLSIKRKTALFPLF